MCLTVQPLPLLEINYIYKKIIYNITFRYFFELINNL